MEGNCSPVLLWRLSRQVLRLTREGRSWCPGSWLLATSLELLRLLGSSLLTIACWILNTVLPWWLRCLRLLSTTTSLWRVLLVHRTCLCLSSRIWELLWLNSWG